MRIVFLGSPEFALPALQKLIDDGHEIVGVFTQPDKPAGRGRKLVAPPVKLLAQEHGLPVFQPKSISKPDSVEQMRALKPEVGVLAAYGQILRQPVLDVPPLGILNVHASLLPRWRGAAPIPASILAGDAMTGATIMKVVLALDAGPMIAATEVAIEQDDTTASLTPRVAEAGAALLIDVLPRWADGTLEAAPQDDALATYAPQIKKSDALIAWARDDAETIARMVRAYNPWPVAYTLLDGALLRILEARPLGVRSGAPAGTVAVSDVGFCVSTTGHDLAALRVQPAGKNAMTAREFARGKRDLNGKMLGS
ncbi:MAG TPA: methionyl-tRNA formyltransferase [Dehalococcoidia bacterium]|nr:methionyl-tRNA formyltransferase [Dehalococcoidia bacterium]